MKRLITYFQSHPDALILILLAAFLRLITLGAESLWFDESFTALVAKPGTDFWKAVLGDDHPPLWSMIQWLNARLLGQSEFAFRLPAAILSVGCVLLIWRIALALKFERKTAFIAGLLTAIIPASIYFGQDGRMYAALAFFILLAIWAALTERWIVFFIACTGAIYTQNAGLLYIFAIGLAVLVTRRSWQETIKPSLALFATGLAWLPWLPTFLIMSERVKVSFWMPPINPLNVWWPVIFDTVGLRQPDMLQIHIYGLVFAVTIIGLFTSRRWLRSRSGFFILIAIFGGPALLAIISAIWQRNILVYRPLLASGLLLMLFWAYALEHLSQQNRRVERIIVYGTLVVAVLSHYTNKLRENLPVWLAPMTSAWQPGDAIYFTNGNNALLFSYYIGNRPYVLRPYHGNIMSITDEAREAFRMTSDNFDDLAAQGYKRAWLLVTHNPFTEPTEAAYIDNILATHSVRVIRNEKTSEISYDAMYLIDLSSHNDF